MMKKFIMILRLEVKMFTSLRRNMNTCKCVTLDEKTTITFCELTTEDIYCNKYQTSLSASYLQLALF